MYKSCTEPDNCSLNRGHCKTMSKQETENEQTTDACLRLGNRLVASGVAHCSPLQSFYCRQTVTLPLRQQEKGRQFLRLAIALVASLGVKSTAVVLTKLFEHEDDSQTPATTSPCIEKVLPANEFRAKTQFRSLISKWQAASGRCSLLDAERKSRPRHAAIPRHTSDIFAEAFPDTDSIVALIKALCNLIKEGGQVKVYATSCWPWVMALLEWLFGPPLETEIGKQPLRCHISVILAETALSSNKKSLCVLHRKNAARVSAKRRTGLQRVTG